MKIYIINFIIIVLSIYSCGTGEPKYTSKIEYTISNVSTHNVKLTVFNALIINDYKDTSFILSPNSDIVYKYDFLTVYDGPFGLIADTVYVFFDVDKQIKYWRDDGKQNSIFGVSSFIGGYTDYGLSKYQYFITDEDYENAEEIN